jgi:hypothetical protein
VTATARVRMVLPIRTVSEANAHTHWRTKATRAKAQRGTVLLALRQPLTRFRQALATSERPKVESLSNGNVVPLNGRGILSPIAVTIRRIAPGMLDSDNLAGSQKHVRDGIADALGIDDRDPRVAWIYSQMRGDRGVYEIEIIVEGNL